MPLDEKKVFMCFDFGGDLEQDTRFSVYFSPFEGSKKQFIISSHRMYRGLA